MTDIMKGMVNAYNGAWVSIPEFDEIEVGQLKAMRAALLWYATQLESEGKHFVAGEVRAAAGGDK